MEATRQLFWHINNGKGLMYIAALAAFFIFCLGISIKIRRWNLGQKVKYRLFNSSRLKKIFFHDSKIYRSKSRRFMHTGIFYGFFILLIGTTVIAVQENLKIHLFYGPFYLALSLLLDLSGLWIMIGLLIGAHKRYINKRDKKNRTIDDAIILSLILIIILTGYILEGLRIFAAGDPWSKWTPVGFTVAYIIQKSGLSISSGSSLYTSLWYIHMLLSFVFIAYIPYSKLFHMMASPLNILLKSSSDIGPLTSSDGNLGVARLEDFTKKQLLELDACLSCLRCEKHCPAYESGADFSPRLLVQNLKKHARHKRPSDSHLIGPVISQEALLSCTSCGLCEEKCPVNEEHVRRIIDMRRSLPSESDNYPHEIQELFGRLSKAGNPWGVAGNNIDHLDAPLISKKKVTDVLYWIGCYGAHDSRNERVTSAMIKILKKAGVDFAITGQEVNCCGDTARRLGNEQLYQQLASANINTLKQYKFNTIVTACPHCFNTLKNEYPDLGGSYKILHHSEFIWQLIETGMIKPQAAKKMKVTFHDPCYLGRYNRVFDAPRKILASISGIELVEMRNRQALSYCCGAGGGQIWMENSRNKTIGILRAEQAVKLEPDTIINACPQCLVNLTEVVNSLKPGIENLDIAEIVSDVI